MKVFNTSFLISGIVFVMCSCQSFRDLNTNMVYGAYHPPAYKYILISDKLQKGAYARYKVNNKTTLVFECEDKSQNGYQIRNYVVPDPDINRFLIADLDKLSVLYYLNENGVSLKGYTCNDNTDEKREISEFKYSMFDPETYSSYKYGGIYFFNINGLQVKAELLLIKRETFYLGIFYSNTVPFVLVKKFTLSFSEYDDFIALPDEEKTKISENLIWNLVEYGISLD